MTTTTPDGAPQKPKLPDIGSTTSGSDLVPDLTKLTKGIVGKYWYWIGALPDAPTEQLWIGSTDFPKQTEKVRRDSRGQTHRLQQIGSVRELTQVDLQRIEDDAKRTVIRFADDTKSPGGPGDGLEALDNKRRKGMVVRIPTGKEIDTAKESGISLASYSADMRDKGAAGYIFMVLCANQVKGERSDEYPESLAVTGLEWPGKME